jgi:hypothetical protein
MDGLELHNFHAKKCGHEAEIRSKLTFANAGRKQMSESSSGLGASKYHRHRSTNWRKIEVPETVSFARVYRQVCMTPRLIAALYYAAGRMCLMAQIYIANCASVELIGLHPVNDTVVLPQSKGARIPCICQQCPRTTVYSHTLHTSDLALSHIPCSLIPSNPSSPSTSIPSSSSLGVGWTIIFA